MEINWSIVAWIAGLIFVYVFGLLEGRGQGYKRRKAEEEQERREQPARAQSTSVNVDDPGILRLKIEDGSSTLDLDGARVNTTSLSPDQRKRLIELLNMIRPWLEGKPATVQTVTTPPPPPPPMPVPFKPVSATTPPAPSNTAAPKTPAIAKEDRPVAVANSIVGQIDSILQMRLSGTPLEERGIFLAQSPEGGVMVFVGLNKYKGIEDVPDAEVKAAIRAAITEWENKYTPGL